MTQGPGRSPYRRRLDRIRARRVIAEAIAEQGPVAREQWSAATDVMRALARAGFVIAPRDPHRALTEQW